MKNKITHVAVYIRVSSDEQAKHGDSIRDQKEAALAYIDGREECILQDVYIDDGVSGQKLDRDDFSRLMDNVKDGEVDLIIFTKLDRWFRSLRHYLNTQATLEKYGVSWLAINQPYFDTSTPYGRAFVAQSMTWAELEAQNGGIRIKDVFKNKVQHGEAITGKVPRGYKILDKHLVFSEEAPIIHDIFAYYLKSQSLHGTIRYMQDTHGITMTLANLKQSVLRNEKYTGRYRGNPNYCPQLIPDDMWSQVQDTIDRNINVKSSQRYPYIFSGILVCAECGYKMSGCHINVKSTRANGNVYRYRYPAYECKQRNAYRKCINGGEIREQRIEEYMLEHARDELCQYVAEYESYAGKVIDNREKKTKIIGKIGRLKDLYLNEVISLEEYKMDRMQFEAQLAGLPDTIEPSKDLTNVKRLLDSNFEEIYQTLGNVEKRRFWRSVVREIRVSKSERRNRKYEIIFL